MRQPQAGEGTLHARDAIGPCCSTEIVHGARAETTNFGVPRQGPTSVSFWLQQASESDADCNEFRAEWGRVASGRAQQGVVAAARGAGVGGRLQAGEELVVAGPLGGGAGERGDR